jgi:hypothetical protein
MKTLLPNKIRLTQHSWQKTFSDEEKFRELINNNFEDIDKIEYKEYLAYALDLINMQAVTMNQPKVLATCEQILEEVPIWLFKDFVWPYVMHNAEGQVILLWKADGITIRFERKTDDSYEAQMYTKSGLSANSPRKRLSVEEFISQFVDVYSTINSKVALSGFDCKSHLTSSREAKVS